MIVKVSTREACIEPTAQPCVVAPQTGDLSIDLDAPDNWRRQIPTNCTSEQNVVVGPHDPRFEQAIESRGLPHLESSKHDYPWNLANTFLTIPRKGGRRGNLSSVL